MPKAENTTITETKTEVVPAVTLTLSTAEAETLRFVLDNIGGPIEGTGRTHTDAIEDALNAAGVRSNTKGRLERSMRFTTSDALRW